MSSDVRNELQKVSDRLFPELPAAEDLNLDLDHMPAVLEPDEETSTASYGEKLAAQFKADQSNQPKLKKISDVAAETVLASKTGELTDRLRKLLKALESIQASSVNAERAFSTAGQFTTKIRNRLGDHTLDLYCFAKHKLLAEKGQVIIVIILNLSTELFYLLV